jgi:hypothetical protein
VYIIGDKSMRIFFYELGYEHVVDGINAFAMLGTTTEPSLMQ